ncbi:MAG: DUF389 domain-containing protein, partial [Bacteroidia bacterium]|nr:DUF389 domain-containing protein [Bacteroidia bacterium]
IGYSVATYDFILLRKSFYNYVFAVGTGLFTSTIYFFISPLNEAHSELLARTSPNIYDVLIALFGGLAGIIAIVSKKKGNVVPGVAIATALMPPLCTAGYGFATAQWDFFFGAFYLFIINSVFIALATLITTRLFKFPVSGKIDEQKIKLANRWVTYVTLITTVPSIYFGYTLVEKDTFKRNSNNFIANETYVEGDYLLKNEINAASREIKLTYGGRTLTDKEKENIISRMNNYHLENAKIIFQQGFTMAEADKQMSEKNQLTTEIGRLQAELQKNKFSNDSLINSMNAGENILSELKAFYPELSDCVAAPGVSYANNPKRQSQQTMMIVLTVRKGKQKSLSQGKIHDWLKARFPGQEIDLVIREK